MLLLVDMLSSSPPSSSSSSTISVIIVGQSSQAAGHKFRSFVIFVSGSSPSASVSSTSNTSASSSSFCSLSLSSTAMITISPSISHRSSFALSSLLFAATHLHFRSFPSTRNVRFISSRQVCPRMRVGTKVVVGTNVVVGDSIGGAVTVGRNVAEGAKVRLGTKVRVGASEGDTTRRVGGGSSVTVGDKVGTALLMVVVLSFSSETGFSSSIISSCSSMIITVSLLSVLVSTIGRKSNTGGGTPVKLDGSVGAFVMLPPKPIVVVGSRDGRGIVVMIGIVVGCQVTVGFHVAVGETVIVGASVVVVGATVGASVVADSWRNRS